MPTSAATQRIIEIDGSELRPEADSQLESALVVDRLAMPDMFVLVFRDPTRDVLSRAGCEIGGKVTISTTALSGDAPEVLIKGEITSIEADYDSLGTRAVVRGYDLSHRLAAGRRTQTFQNTTLSDIASQIANDAGLTPDVDDSQTTLEHVLQANQSDLEFLYLIARRIGYDCRVDDETLVFKRPTESTTGPAAGDAAATEPTQLVWGVNLLEFRARISAVAQVKEVMVRGWDVSSKEPVIGQASVASTNASLALSNQDLAGRIGGETLVVVDHPIGDQETADELAAARAEQVGSAAFEATGVALGSPALKAGTAVSISGVDPALRGQWVISGSRHEFGGGAYRTFLEFTGRQDRSLPGVLTGAGGGGAGASRIPGVVIGVVTDNEDPQGMGRVRVRLPWLADDAESWWARLAQPGAGKDYGMAWIPQVGDEVLVAFGQGDMAYPFVIGGLWNGEDSAPLGDDLFDAGLVKRSGFISRGGHKLVFFDAEDRSGIALITANNKFRVSLNETDGQLHLYFDGKLLVDGTGDIEIKTQGAMKLEASQAVEIKGSTIALN
jgi:phage protein D